jgi:hypothetical protein
VFALLGDHTAAVWRILGPIASEWISAALLGVVANRFAPAQRRAIYLTAALIALCSGLLLPVMWAFLSANGLRR